RTRRGRRLRNAGWDLSWIPSWIAHGLGPPALRQGNELGLSGHLREAPRFPVGRGLRDALLAARHEIPPHVARRIERRTAEEHEACGFAGADDRFAARLEHRHLARVESLAVDLHASLHDVDAALLVRRGHGE